MLLNRGSWALWSWVLLEGSTGLGLGGWTPQEQGRDCAWGRVTSQVPLCHDVTLLVVLVVLVVAVVVSQCHTGMWGHLWAGWGLEPQCLTGSGRVRGSAGASCLWLCP